MHPIALAALMGLAPKVIEQFTGGASKPAQPQRQPAVISPIEAAQFTEIESGARRFQHDIGAKIPTMLGARSALPVAPSPQAPTARVWRVVPARPGLLSAAQTIEYARSDGLIVLGALSLILLPTGVECPWVLVAADPETARRLASPAGQLAIISDPKLAEKPAEEPKLVKPANGARDVAKA